MLEKGKFLVRSSSEHGERAPADFHRTHTIQACTARPIAPRAYSIFDHIVGPYWCVGTDNIMQTKLEDDDTYKGGLRQRFDRC